MAFPAMVNSRVPVRSSLLLKLCIVPNISSSLFSSLCTRKVFLTHPTEAPPVPKKIPFTVTAHGRSWEDPYHWMSKIDDPDLSDYLNRENSYAEAFMADTQDLQHQLFTEMNHRTPSVISTPPECWGPWLYYQHIPEGKEYPVICRRLNPKKNSWAKCFLNYVRNRFRREEILLDWNGIAEQFGYYHMGTCRVSPDHRYLAYTLDTTAEEQFTLHIKDLKHGKILPQLNVSGVVNLAWAQDGRTLFYTVSDETKRPYRVLCTKIGSDSVDSIPIFTENNSSFCLDITNTKDGKFITVNSSSRTSSEVYLIDANKPSDGFRCIRKRLPGVRYFLEHHNGFFYILTNAPFKEDKDMPTEDYYLAKCRFEEVFSSANWQTVILPSENFSLQDIDIFNGHLVLFLNKNGSPAICSLNLPIEDQMEFQCLNPWFFPLPSDCCDIAPGSNHDFMTSVYRVVLSSPVMPEIIVDYDMSSHKFSIVHQEEVLGISSNYISCSPANDVTTENEMPKIWKDFSSKYNCERKEVISDDGIAIPLTVLYSRKAWKRDQSPGLLIGYGAYDVNLDKSWCSDRLSLLDRGWIIAFADVRGGGGGDNSWHKSGSGLCKRNSIYDFVICGKYLVNEGYVHKDLLSAMGISAGGLLVGAAINMHPNLFCSAVLKVPFLDVCNTLLDPSLPLTILDYDEFGNPEIKSHFEYILSYSPYDGILQRVCYPSVLVTASFHDSRVGVWDASKWVAKVRDRTCSNCSQSIILKTNMSGGHFSDCGRFGHSEETAYEYAFLMKTMGLIQNMVKREGSKIH